jgi:hypothetical protein
VFIPLPLTGTNCPPASQDRARIAFDLRIVNDVASMPSPVPAQSYEMLRWIVEHVLFPVFTFFAGMFSGLSQHVQKPLADYRETLTDISKLMLGSVHVMYEQRNRTKTASPESKQLYDNLRSLHGRLVSSSNAIPWFARPVLRLLGLLRSQKQINEGARMLIGISNQVITADKDLPHLHGLTDQLAEALAIAV